jgi:hypothetical protein
MCTHSRTYLLSLLACGNKKRRVVAIEFDEEWQEAYI